MIGLAIFTAPVQWLTSNPVLTYNLAFIASFVHAGAGMYLLARALTGRRDAAALAALAYAFTPFRIAHLAHLQWLMTGWLPLSLWALHRYFSTGAFSVSDRLGRQRSPHLLQSLNARATSHTSGSCRSRPWRRSRPGGRGRRLSANRLRSADDGSRRSRQAILAPVVAAYYRARADSRFREEAGRDRRAERRCRADYFRAWRQIHVALWRMARQARANTRALFPV